MIRNLSETLKEISSAGQKRSFEIAANDLQQNLRRNGSMIFGGIAMISALAVEIGSDGAVKLEGLYLLIAIVYAIISDSKKFYWFMLTSALCTIVAKAAYLGTHTETEAVLQAIIGTILYCAVALAISLLVFRLELTQRDSLTDQLTGVFNRRALAMMAPQLLEDAASEGMELGLIAFDVDDFKKINDKQGHAAGDMVLLTIGRVLRQNNLMSALPVRTGGDEFVILMSVKGPEQLAIAGKSLKKEIERQLVTINIPTTVSLGFVSYTNPPEDLEVLLSEVDSMLYHAKREAKYAVHLSAMA